MFRSLSNFLLAAMLLLSNCVALAQVPDTALQSAGSAKVVFYRSVEDGGKAYALTSQNQELAKLKKGEKFEQILAPGTYYYMADPSTKQVFKLDVVAGQTYYVYAGRDGNFFNGQPTLRLSTLQEYQQDLVSNN